MNILHKQDRRVIRSALRSAAAREAHDRTRRSNFFAADHSASQRREHALRQTLSRVSR